MNARDRLQELTDRARTETGEWPIVEISHVGYPPGSAPWSRFRLLGTLDGGLELEAEIAPKVITRAIAFTNGLIVLFRK